LHERELRELLCRHLRAVRDLARRRLDLEGLWPWLRDELRWARDCAAARRCSEATGWRTAADALCPCRRWWRGFAGQDGGLRRLERLLYEGRVALARHVTWARGLPDPHPRIRARRDELVAMYEAVDGLRRSVRRTQNALVHGAMPLLDDSGRDTAFRRLRRAAELLDRRGWQRPESFRKSWEEQDDLWRQLRHLR